MSEAIACAIIAGIVSVFGTWLANRRSQAIFQAVIETKFAEHLRYLPMGYFNENSLGSITSVTTNTMDNLSGLATRVTMFVTEGIVSTAVLTLAVFLFDWRVGLLIVAGVVIYYFVNHALQKNRSRRRDESLPVILR